MIQLFLRPSGPNWLIESVLVDYFFPVKPGNGAMFSRSVADARDVHLTIELARKRAVVLINPMSEPNFRMLVDPIFFPTVFHVLGCPMSVRIIRRIIGRITRARFTRTCVYLPVEILQDNFCHA